MFKLLCNVIAFASLSSYIAFQAQASEIPTGVSMLTAPEVRKMVDNKEALLVHTLSRIEYHIQHIPGSINIPVDEIQHSTSMPADKNQPIIFYCNGLACPYSRRASETAVKIGYRHIYWFRGGIQEWRKFQYEMAVDESLSKIQINKLSPTEFRRQAKGKVLVLDVRPKWWRKSSEQAGVIKGTEMMIPLLILDKRLDRLPKDRPILLVDRLMRQAPYAAQFLQANGYQILGVLKGGTRRWEAERLPVLKQRDEPPILD